MQNPGLRVLLLSTGVPLIPQSSLGLATSIMI